MSYVLSQIPQPQAFHRQADPVRAFFGGLQQFLHVPVTGIWDYATHDALRSFLKRGRATNEIGDWGRDPGKVASNAQRLLTPAAEDEFQRVRSLLALLGLPSDSLDSYRQYQQVELASMLTVGDMISDAIRAAEHRVAAPQPPATVKRGSIAQRAGVGLIAMGGILFLTGLTWALTRRRT